MTDRPTPEQVDAALNPRQRRMLPTMSADILAAEVEALRAELAREREGCRTPHLEALLAGERAAREQAERKLRAEAKLRERIGEELDKTRDALAAAEAFGTRQAGAREAAEAELAQVEACRDALEAYDRWAAIMPSKSVTRFEIWEGWWRKRPERQARAALAPTEATDE